MNLELNLVKIGSIDSRTSKLISRDRVIVEDDTMATDEILKFLNNNLDAVSAAVTDKVLINKIRTASSLTVTDIDCLRYMLSLRGIDLWYYQVSDGEVGKNDISEDTIEYLVMDRSGISKSFVPFVAKIVHTANDSKLTDVYNRAVELYGLFSGELFTGIINPITKMSNVMKESEDALGITPSMQSMYINSIFDFLKKELRTITN